MKTPLKEKQVVTCFLESDGEILILLRSDRVSTHRGEWAGVSGSIDIGRTADEQALAEIGEETGLGGEEIELMKKGEPLVVKDVKLGVKWVVHPYLFHIKDRGKVRIDWEHKEARWIAPQDIDSYQTVPCLKETLARVYRTG